MDKIAVKGAAMAMMALGLSACTVKQYMGISTRTPVSAQEQARLESALAAAPLDRTRGCPWRSAGGGVTTVACEAMPLPRLAALAGMDHKAALLELGIRFEEGRGVARDWDKAELAYRLAAWQNSYIAGQQVAGVGSSQRAIEPIMVPGAPGLETAEVRLAALRARKKGS